MPISTDRQATVAHNPHTTVRKIFTLPKELWARVEDFRFERRLKTESEALRVLIEDGLSYEATFETLMAVIDLIKRRKPGIWEDDQFYDEYKEVIAQFTDMLQKNAKREKEGADLRRLIAPPTDEGDG